MAKILFTNPSVMDKVILTQNGVESQQRIVEVTAKAIRVSSCNLYRFNRTGALNKHTNYDGRLSASIRPIDAPNAQS